MVVPLAPSLPVELPLLGTRATESAISPSIFFSPRWRWWLARLRTSPGHHGKATALLTRSRRFHCCVERQDIGLEGDTVLITVVISAIFFDCGNTAHGGHHLLTSEPPRLAVVDAIRQLACLTCAFGVQLHGGSELLHAGCCLFPARQPALRYGRRRSLLPLEISVAPRQIFFTARADRADRLAQSCPAWHSATAPAVPHSYDQTVQWAGWRSPCAI